MMFNDEAKKVTSAMNALIGTYLYRFSEFTGVPVPHTHRAAEREAAPHQVCVRALHNRYSHIIMA